jgi:hypothetical protein
VTPRLRTHLTGAVRESRGRSHQCQIHPLRHLIPAALRSISLLAAEGWTRSLAPPRVTRATLGDRVPAHAAWLSKAVPGQTARHGLQRGCCDSSVCWSRLRREAIGTARPTEMSRDCCAQARSTRGAPRALSYPYPLRPEAALYSGLAEPSPHRGQLSGEVRWHFESWRTSRGTVCQPGRRRSRSIFGRPGNAPSHHLSIADPLPGTTQFRDVDGAMPLEFR